MRAEPAGVHRPWMLTQGQQGLRPFRGLQSLLLAASGPCPAQQTNASKWAAASELHRRRATARMDKGSHHARHNRLAAVYLESALDVPRT